MKRAVLGVAAVVLAGSAIAAAAPGLRYEVDQPAAADAVGIAGQAARGRMTFNPNEKMQQERLFAALQTDPDRYRRVRITFQAGPTPREIAIYSKGIDGSGDSFSIRANEYFIVAGLKYENYRRVVKLDHAVSRADVDRCLSRVASGPAPSEGLAGCLATKVRR